MSLSRLTPSARSKWEVMMEAEHDAQALSSSALRRISELRHLAIVSGEDGRAPEYDREITRLQTKQIAHEERRLQLVFITTRIRNFIDTLPTDAVIADAKKPKPKRKAGETHGAAVERVRSEIIDLSKRCREVQACGLPIQEMKAQVLKWVSERARLASPKIRADHIEFNVDFAATTLFAKISAQDVLCWFDPDGMVLKLNEEIAAMPTPKLAMTPANKHLALTTLSASLLDHELVEEALIEAAAQSGTTIARRPDVSPQAVLGIAITIQAVKAA